jgi:hypothetical protein
VQGAQGALGDQLLVEEPQFLLRPGHREHRVPFLVIAVRRLCRYDAEVR